MFVLLRHGVVALSFGGGALPLLGLANFSTGVVALSFGAAALPLLGLANFPTGVVALSFGAGALLVNANSPIACKSASGGGGGDEAAGDPSAALLLRSQACRGQRHKHTFGLPGLRRRRPLA